MTDHHGCKPTPSPRSLFSLCCLSFLGGFWLLCSSNSDDQMGNKEKYEAQSRRALVNVAGVCDMYGPVIRNWDGGWAGSCLVGSQAAYVASRLGTQKVKDKQMRSRKKAFKGGRKRETAAGKRVGRRKMREKGNWLPPSVM